LTIGEAEDDEQEKKANVFRALHKLLLLEMPDNGYKILRLNFQFQVTRLKTLITGSSENVKEPDRADLRLEYCI
jgi:hypothetical protein